MKDQSFNLGEQTLWQRMVRAWDRFWFTPRDPTVLGLIRICCGLITLYTTLAYVGSLHQFIGPYGWVDVQGRLDELRNKAVVTPPLNWDELAAHRPPSNEVQEKYVAHYVELWGQRPPGEYPTNDKDAVRLNVFRKDMGFDLRMHGLPIPRTEAEWQYAYRFSLRNRYAPTPGRERPYPAGIEHGDFREEEAINRYIDDYGIDPRLASGRGIRAWSLWLHVTDPAWMAVFQCLMILVTVLFTIGFCTRITSVLTWLGAISYMHRNPYMLFGVDTMMNIVLIYLMIGPSGAALSVDRLLARWWSRAKPRTVNWWRGLFGLGPRAVTPPPPPPEKPEPRVSANVATRLLQIHLCIIYVVAGLAKLLGKAWWEGSAVWGTLASFEFAPMQYTWYTGILRILGQNRLVFEVFLTISVYFTLFFEICYCFLIWRPAMRWVMLGMALVLHGGIGMFMGLYTFSLMMLVMNMAFLKTSEANWVLNWIWPKPPAQTPAPPAEPQREVVSAAAFRPAVKEPVTAATQAIKKKSG